MRHNFTIKQVNSPFEDTAFFVRNIYKRQAFLLDCGRLGDIENTEILSISDIFVSHTHIDHFYGFDRILRGMLRSDKKVRVFGPTGIIKNVKGKLDAYTWNLIKNYTFKIEVFELGLDGKINCAMFDAANGFVPECFNLVVDRIELEDGFVLEYEFFDHGISSVGYRIKEEKHVNIKKDVFDKFGYIPGPWLTVLKSKLRNCVDLKEEIDVETTDGIKKVSLKELEQNLVIYKEPQDITFITDIAPTYENFKKAVNFAKNSFVLLIEAMFLKDDVLDAIYKKHLTVELAKKIFQVSGAKFVKFFHFAPKYERDKNKFFLNLYSELNNKILKTL
ncbi:ribonuclease Z [Deferribacter desulfuricans SSM1]|uniref:Ribonuclease Z n=1 Tax=Deferribacter desulfuricans (strain DSM 14783 / JCM 11476 / NBRC 101012 / SSM1) TaxID=639282 RepID=D3PE42_DEFDS|nr:ribonuclease Z [Deferribacter desulfuricans]BAI80865.1 ribonuclease Z [Deferribacter desulfuricans SSM1]